MIEIRPTEIIFKHNRLFLHLLKPFSLLRRLSGLINIHWHLLLHYQRLMENSSCEILLIGSVGLDLEKVAIDWEYLRGEVLEKDLIDNGDCLVFS